MQDTEPTFYLAAMSPYSWFAAERIEQVLPEARWVAVTAAFIFKASGRRSWGLTGARAGGIADCERRARAHGLGPIRWPAPWPTNDVPVARAMTFADMRGLLRPFALAAMRLAFIEGRDLAELDALLTVGGRCGIETEELAGALQDGAVKQELRRATDGASELGVFGVPTVLVGGELFWGDDRLEEAAECWRRLAAEDRGADQS